jgi:hypothetical protein
MFTDIYVSIQSSQVLQERWLREADQARRPQWTNRLRRVFVKK